MLLNPFVLSKIPFETISHAQQETGTSMFEEMQTPIKHVRGKMHPCLLQGFQQLGEMFCRMGKIQDTHRIRPMRVSKELQPVGCVAKRKLIW